MMDQVISLRNPPCRRLPCRCIWCDSTAYCWICRYNWYGTLYFSSQLQAEAFEASILGNHESNCVIYVLLPENSSSLLIERMLSLVSPVETCFTHFITSNTLEPRQMQAIAFQVYDRVPCLVERIKVQGEPMAEAPVYLHYPRFTTAPDSPPKIALSLAWPLKSYDVLNRWRLVNVAYGLDPKLQLLVAFAIDAEGEEWRVETWTAVTGDNVAEYIDKIWNWSMVYAKTAAIEWRLTVTRLGSMTSNEYSGNSDLLPHYPRAEWR